MTMRSGFLRAVAARLPALDRPMLVAIDGVDGSGKTTLADELAAVLGADGRAVTRASVDVDVPFETSVARMARRDGSVPDVGDPGQARYIEGQRIYLVGCRPRERADLVVDNSDLLRPRFGRTPARPLSQKGNPRKTRAND